MDKEICYNTPFMWKAYLKERENVEVLELEHGFAIIRQLPDCLYLQDIYVKPEYRKQGYGKHILGIVEDAARSMGYNKVLGSCSPPANGSTVSLKSILASGFELTSCDKDIIYLTKYLDEDKA